MLKNIKIGFLAVLIISSCKPDSKPAAQIVDSLFGYDSKHNLSPDARFGDFFSVVQTDSTLFGDSKTFVDALPLHPTDSILHQYLLEKGQAGFSMGAFLKKNFIIPSNQPSNYVSDNAQSVSAHITTLWDVLKRPADTLDIGSKLPLPNPYIVPGGRFREVYYWDSYFTMLGLVADNRVDEVEKIIDNFAFLLDKYGFIPNGNRSYYLTRSQPPFFACMVQLLATVKGDEVYIKYLPALEKEYAFWMRGEKKDIGADKSWSEHVVQVDGHTMNRYKDAGDVARPEGFKEDEKSASTSKTRSKKEIFNNLRSGAESGWDFSTRWFADGKTIGSINITDLIPTDLNALIYNLEMCIMKAKIIDKKTTEAEIFEKKAAKRRESVMHFNWNEEKGFFYDFNANTFKQNEDQTLAAIYPLYFKMVSASQAKWVAKNIEKNFLKSGGVVTTLNKSGQQWDAPNGWPPLQWLTIQGLRNYGYNALADDITNRWLALNEKVYANTGKMLEKYNVEDVSLISGGGEYPVQDGFGWTNGVYQALKKGLARFQ